MKYFIFFLTVVTCFGCKQSTAKTESSTDDMTSDPIKELLTMKGDGTMPHVVLVSGDEEYRSEEALPQLAKILSQKHGFKCTVLFAQDPEEPGIVDANNVHHIPGLEHLRTADMMVIFTRFRALPDDQMKHIDDYLKSGRPVLGIRTATHAFHFTEADSASNYQHYGNFYNGDDEWKDGFGRLVLGEKWISHHGHHAHQSTRGLAAPGAEDHEILNGIAEGDIWGPTDVYGVRLPLPGDSQPIVLGQVVERAGEFDEEDPRLGMRPSDTEPAGMASRKDREGKEVQINLNDPMMPIAWTKSYQIPGGKRGKAFTTTVGSSTDMLSEGVRRLMVNAVFWCLDKEVPAKADVDLIGNYNPTRFSFKDDDFWENRDLEISSLE